MIDEDFEASKKMEVIDNIKKHYGYDKVLNIGTFSTIGSHSVIQIACRGLHIDNVESDYIVSLLPTDNDGKEMDITTAILGNEKKKIKPNKALNKELDVYPNLKQLCLNLYGLVVGRSVHASAVFIDKQGYVTRNTLMQSTNGIYTSQFDADDTEYTGMIKFDLLSLDGLDRIRNSMKLLEADHKIENQGSLKATFEKYFDIDKLDFTSDDMYDLLFNGDVINAFQFSTTVGNKTLKKLNARRYMDLVTGNGLMRLNAEKGEQPLDKYIRFKNDLSQWDKEMDEYHLTVKEKQILHKHLDEYYGICSSQETLMQVSIDKNITNYTLEQANKLRKTIAKKDKKKQEIEKQNFFERGLENGTRQEFLDYIWTNCVMIQRGYAFSISHSLPYSLVLIIEMNICKYYGKIYWQTACLNVNAKTMTDDFENPDYQKVARAIGELPKGLVESPDINRSKLSFIPGKIHILFGLNAVAGIGKQELTAIFAHRPYSKFTDFYKKCHNEITDRKMVVLIKAGCFDSLFPDRYKLMVKFVKMIMKPKEKLTTVQLKKIYHAVPDELKQQSDLYRFSILAKKPIVKQRNINYFTNQILPLVEDKYKPDEMWSMNDNGQLVVDLKLYKKFMNNAIKPLKEWLKTPDATKAEALVRCREFWKINCDGNIPKWEMETLNYYTDKTELQCSNINRYISYESFNDLDPNPKPIGYNEWRGHKYPQYDKTVIAGAVIDKNNNKGIVTILTDNGVADVRLGRQRYSKYSKKVMEGKGKNRHCVDPNWFERGTLLAVVGTRIQNDFKVNNKKTSYQTALMRIVGWGDNIGLVSEKRA